MQTFAISDDFLKFCEKKIGCKFNKYFDIKIAILFWYQDVKPAPMDCHVIIKICTFSTLQVFVCFKSLCLDPYAFVFNSFDQHFGFQSLHIVQHVFHFLVIRCLSFGLRTNNNIFSYMSFQSFSNRRMVLQLLAYTFLVQEFGNHF